MNCGHRQVILLVRNYSQVRKKVKIVPVTNSYRIYTFGMNETGALGFDESSKLSRTKFYFSHPIRQPFAELNKVKKVACGYGFTAFYVKTRDKIKLFGTGINSERQVNCRDETLIRFPTPLDIGLKGEATEVVSMSGGRGHLGIVTDNEGTFLLGSNQYGQCGREIKPETEFQITRINRLDGDLVKSVTCGQDHTTLLTESGTVYSCGWGADGQTGLDSIENQSTLSPVRGDLSGVDVVKVAGKCDTVLALSRTGDIFGWGSSEYEQLSKESLNLNRPVHLAHVNKVMGKIVDVDAGVSSCIALNEEGEVYVWGSGILGGGPNLSRSVIPFRLPKTLFGCNAAQPAAKVVKVFSGFSHFVALNNLNHLYSWGKNRHGCLGIGHSRDQHFPYKIALSADAVDVSCGVDHTMVLATPFQ